MQSHNQSTIGCLMFALFALMLAACNAQATPTTVEVVAATNTPPPTETPPPSETPTATLTLTPTDTVTFTPTPTVTDTPTPSVTPKATKTRTPRPTFTPAPTATDTPNPRPIAPVFADTQMLPFDVDAFIQKLKLVHDKHVLANILLGPFLQGKITGKCQWYYDTLSSWYSLPGFFGVPDQWYSLYYEYRSLLYTSVTTTAEIKQVCDAGGGPISDETAQAARNALDYAEFRSFQMIWV